MCSRARERQQGFSLIELLVVLALVAVLTSIGVPQLMQGYDRTRQRSSMADMRSIAVANGIYHTDNSRYAANFSELQPAFMNPVPPADAWGTPWAYTSSGKQYSVASLGADGITGQVPPADWFDEPFEADLIVQNGAFTQAPGGKPQ